MSLLSPRDTSEGLQHQADQTRPAGTQWGQGTQRGSGPSKRRPQLVPFKERCVRALCSPGASTAMARDTEGEGATVLSPAPHTSRSSRAALTPGPPSCPAGWVLWPRAGSAGEQQVRAVNPSRSPALRPFHLEPKVMPGRHRCPSFCACKAWSCAALGVAQTPPGPVVPDGQHLSPWPVPENQQQ